MYLTGKEKTLLVLEKALNNHQTQINQGRHQIDSLKQKWMKLKESKESKVNEKYCLYAIFFHEG